MFEFKLTFSLKFGKSSFSFLGMIRLKRLLQTLEEYLHEFHLRGINRFEMLMNIGNMGRENLPEQLVALGCETDNDATAILRRGFSGHQALFLQAINYTRKCAFGNKGFVADISHAESLRIAESGNDVELGWGQIVLPDKGLGIAGKGLIGADQFSHGR